MTGVYDSVLLRHADDDWTWWLDIHHIATDAWSSALIFEATSAIYEHATDFDAHETEFDLGSVIDGSFYEYAPACTQLGNECVRVDLDDRSCPVMDRRHQGC